MKYYKKKHCWNIEKKKITFRDNNNEHKEM